jgi:hypothetical protein
MGGENIPVKATLSHPKQTDAYIKILKKEVVIHNGNHGMGF